MKNPYVRLALRAVAAAAGAFLAQLQAADRLDGTVLRSALVGAAMAGLELFTPVNPNVGVGK